MAAAPHLGQEQTTWRVGDAGFTRAFCTTEGATIEAASVPGDEAFILNIEKGLCNIWPFDVPVILERFVGGPYETPLVGMALSVWGVKSPFFEDTVFIMIYDVGGPHAAVHLQSL